MKHVKKISFIISIGIITLLIPIKLKSQTFPSGGNTGIQVVNLSTNSTTVSATYYAEDGTKYTLLNINLPNQGDTYTYFAEPGITSTFTGATILSANNKIEAIANTFFSSNNSVGAYNSLSKGSNQTLLPLITKSFAGGSTAISVQNTNKVYSATAEINFTPQDVLKFSGVKTYTIQPGASQRIDLGLDSDFETAWIGSASISPQSTNTPLVASALIYTSNYVYVYSGFTNTGTKWYLPLIRSEFAGFSTGIQVINSEPVSVPTTIRYLGKIWPDFNPNNATDYTCIVSATIPPNASITFFNAGTWPLANVLGATDGQVIGGDCKTNGDTTFAAAGGAFLGAAILFTSGETSVVVNDSNSGTSSAAYNGFLNTQAYYRIISPLSRVAYAGFSTSTQVQNTCTKDITVSTKYVTSPLSGNLNTPSLADQLIPAGTAYTFLIGSGGGFDNWLGSLTISTNEGNCLVGITNDATPGGDASIFNTVPIP